MNFPFSHIRESLRPYSKRFWLALSFIFIHTLVGCLLIFFSRNIQQNIFPVYIIFIFSFHQIFSIFDDWILTGLSHAWTRDTRRNILQLYIRQGLPISGNSQQDWNEIQKEIYWLGESIFSFFRGTFRRILQISVFSAFLLYLSPSLFSYCLVFFLLLLAAGFGSGRILNEIRSRYIHSESSLATFELEAAHARDIIRVHGKSSFMEKIHSTFLERSLRDAVFFDRIRMMQHPLQVILFLVTVAIIFYAGNHLVETGNLSSQNFYAFLSGLSLLYTPLSGISNDVGAFLSLSKLKYLNFIVQQNPAFEDSSDVPKQVHLSRISLKNLSFSYTSTPLFQNLNLDINVPILGFRGKNGSGKTTLALLLCRVLSPGEGTIEFFDDHEKNIDSIPISYIDQNGTVFSLSLENNLFLPHLPKLQFLQYFPEMLQKESMGPENISSGQKKAVSIERALQHPSSLLIIDEPENALDSSKKMELRNILLEKNKNGVMIVLFSHDDFFLEICSNVMDMQILRAAEPSHVSRET